MGSSISVALIETSTDESEIRGQSHSQSKTGNEGILAPSAYSCWIRGLFILLCILAGWSFIWPVYRAFLNIEIDCNEGWNAYFADAAMGRMPLYPHADQLLTNNYPPLSYFIVGALGTLIGDPILAGRLLSLVAIIGIAGAIIVAVRRLGGNREGALIGAVFFVGTISRFYVRYAGMDDPQLLAHAVMTFAFAGLLGALARNRGYPGPILLMVTAGFIKHNIVAIPLTACTWLAIVRPRVAIKVLPIALGAVTVGFYACYWAYGHDFFTNLFSPRVYSWNLAIEGIGALKPLDAALAGSVLVGIVKMREPLVRLSSLLTGVSLGAYFLQRTGAGVDVNAAFDLLIATAIGIGLAFTHAPSIPLPGSWLRVLGADTLRTVLLLALFLRLLPTRRMEELKPVRLLFDPTFQSEIAIRGKAMDDSVARVRATPGNVICSTYVCYRSGKPLTVDLFNADQRMATGALPHNELESRLKRRLFTKVATDPRADWDKPLLPSGR